MQEATGNPVASLRFDGEILPNATRRSASDRSDAMSPRVYHRGIQDLKGHLGIPVVHLRAARDSSLDRKSPRSNCCIPRSIPVATERSNVLAARCSILTADRVKGIACSRTTAFAKMLNAVEGGSPISLHTSVKFFFNSSSMLIVMGIRSLIPHGFYVFPMYHIRIINCNKVLFRTRIRNARSHRESGGFFAIWQNVERAMRARRRPSARKSVSCPTPEARASSGASRTP